jgi:hypothetical protein
MTIGTSDDMIFLIEGLEVLTTLEKGQDPDDAQPFLPRVVQLG